MIAAMLLIALAPKEAVKEWEPEEP
jgi:hypothetical protein